MVMGLQPTQADQKCLGPATTFHRTFAPPFVIPSSCVPWGKLRRNDTSKMAIDVRPGGPTAKRQPSPEGLGNRSRRGSERRRRGTNRSSALPVSLGAKPTCPGVPWRDLKFRGPLLETRNLVPHQICHLDRSVAERRDLRFLSTFRSTACLAG
jgi:hypothetical protein